METTSIFAHGWPNLCLTFARLTVQSQQLTQNIDRPDTATSWVYHLAFLTLPYAFDGRSHP
jgi:hypothetical protein